MADLLYRWPAAAKFGRRVPKEKLYAQSSVTPAVREKFVSEVQRITWSYKLAESTINLPGSPEVPEIQVFQLDAKKEDVSEQVLLAIDKAIPFPIIFEILRDDRTGQSVRMVAAHKQLGTGRSQLSDYFSTGWQSVHTERRTLPTTITLPNLYTALLAPLMPVTVRPGEDMLGISARLNIVGTLEREIAALKRKLSAELQLNRKIEIHRALKAKQAELEQQR
ncbi:DUF4391 domain-containing protein [Corynebacterium glutamicum]|uniref:DUF4391 domain-containing protein n=1 Tax=Corynebacterium glutamicum TaxID=1718 RepID=UPI00117DB1A8|nr:DUF4391 domain-containing protein [Corynebacterium glutamicum]QDQ19720.1 DUF4391 domain-containing protein [Corynebacterium glutamicum]QDQ23287.1 DUF4391 domain-containing protein [Corynebacterium glutamicum]